MGSAVEPKSLRHRSPALALGMIVLLVAFALVPPVRGSASLLPTFLAVGAGLALWALALWALPAVRRRGFAIDLVPPVKAHYVQTAIQLCIYAYWGWYWRRVYAEAPLILAQVVFLYAWDALWSWSRGRSWRLGFGPLPIILSINLFLWFRDDWFYLQFLLIASCSLGKDFLRWERDGRRTHVFNPSAFGLGLFSILLIATGTTTRLTWGVEVATTLGLPPYIYVLIFGLGLVVQYLFSVTLMTLSAVVALVLLNLAYTGTTGVYHFVDTNIPIAVFLGLHLLMTDPSTSPRTNVGRVIFGALYGVGSFALYGVLRDLGSPEFYDKLLTVPILNMSVQVLDRLAGFGWIGALDRWQERWRPRSLNLVTMGCWSALFAVLLGTGFVEGPHPGASIAFWRKAAAEGKPRAAENVVRMLQARAAKGSGDASNELGTLYLEGELVQRDVVAATQCFARAFEQGSEPGGENLVAQFLAVDDARAGGLVERALARLERGCASEPGGRSSYLVGRAYETGHGRPRDPGRALALYRQASALGSDEAREAVRRMSLQGAAESGDAKPLARSDRAPIRPRSAGTH